MGDKPVNVPPSYLRWPHIQADQVHGLSLREIGGFTKHHRAPSTRAACYTVAKPSSMVQKMQNIKKLRGHRNAVYCAIFDRSGRYVITGSDDRLVKIWSNETAFCLASCRGHEGDITDLAVSYNNFMVASSSNDFIIRVWRLPDGAPISVLRGHTGVVTAIAFSPKPGCSHHLLSSSDDGTCRIWDARLTQASLRLYIPKPLDSVVGKSNGQPSGSVPQNHQILCCAYNASGAFFVTGSSDTFARVWNAGKGSNDKSEQHIHEMDVLSGHENDVNYVQFSGCSVSSKYSMVDNMKEDSSSKFRNSWSTHDNIVTCSRDGSAIIWISRSRRSHGKIGRWTRAYHLKVPPPPIPLQSSSGGPRQRLLPTPRGVNMIIWSLDNRFVLAAIMDRRICVWNAVDGSLVHSLTGHSESAFVLDVHPFNPRMAMSAGYDGRTIVWDIWEGSPIRIYEIGRFKLVDGKFSPDGTSIVLSDDVGQLYSLSTGQGESQKEAKYDQFFLGDYRPLVRDVQGNVMDQDTQLVPYQRNIQDVLCDSSMIPYPEPYQSMYQKRRLGALGIEYIPLSAKFSVGPVDLGGFQEYQILPLADLDRVVQPMPEFIEAMDWEPEHEIQSDENDSEYNVDDEVSTEGEQGHIESCLLDETECSAETEDSEEDDFRRPKRQKKRVEFSRRGAKKQLLSKRGGTSSLSNRRRKSEKNKAVIRRSSRPKVLRTQRNVFLEESADDCEDTSESDSSFDAESEQREKEGDSVDVCDNELKPQLKKKLIFKFRISGASTFVGNKEMELGKQSLVPESKQVTLDGRDESGAAPTYNADGSMFEEQAVDKVSNGKMTKLRIKCKMTGKGVSQPSSSGMAWKSFEDNNKIKTKFPSGVKKVETFEELVSCNDEERSNALRLRVAKEDQRDENRSSWLMLSKQEESLRYIPQKGDKVVYLRQGHLQYVPEFATTWGSRKPRNVEYCKIISLAYSTFPGSGESCSKIALEFVDPCSSLFGQIFKLTLPELNDFPDFLVERTLYDASVERNWTTGDRCRVWWKNPHGGGFGGNWWSGQVVSVLETFGNSPWEKYVVRYNSLAEIRHSPWELHDPENPLEDLPDNIAEESIRKLLSFISKLDESGNTTKDPYGIERLKQISWKQDFLNRFPVAVSFDLIEARLANKYYRSLESVEHDFEVMTTNAQVYFEGDTEFTKRMTRLMKYLRQKLLDCI
ncbi:hypothetical protein ACHQM5_025733 [Ranunculus cassubicifolius]